MRPVHSRHACTWVPYSRIFLAFYSSHCWLNVPSIPARMYLELYLLTESGSPERSDEDGHKELSIRLSANVNYLVLAG